MPPTIWSCPASSIRTATPGRARSATPAWTGTCRACSSSCSSASDRISGREDVYAATLFGRLAALDAGVTTLLDWAHIQNSPDHADEAIRALREAGGRTIYAHGQPGIEPERWMKESTLPHPADIRRLRERVLVSDDALVTLAMAARGPEFTTIETTEHDLRLARELGLRITIHIGLGANGPKYRGVERMHAAQAARARRHIRALLQLQRPRIPPDGGDRDHGLRCRRRSHRPAAASACLPPAGCWRTACARA